MPQKVMEQKKGSEITKLEEVRGNKGHAGDLP